MTSTWCRERPRMRAVVIAIVCGLALSTHARAEDGAHPGDEHIVRGQKLFDAGHYPEAIEELRSAYVVTGQPRFLYSLGQAYRLNHQCAQAVQSYRDFVRANPSRAQIAAAEDRIKLCGQEDPSSLTTPAPPAAEPVAQGPVTPPPVVTIPASGVQVTTPATRAPRIPVVKRWWLWTTVGIVAVGIGVGVGLGVGLTQHHFDPSVAPFGPGK